MNKIQQMVEETTDQNITIEDQESFDSVTQFLKKHDLVKVKKIIDVTDKMNVSKKIYEQKEQSLINEEYLTKLILKIVEHEVSKQVQIQMNQLRNYIQ